MVTVCLGIRTIRQCIRAHCKLMLQGNSGLLTRCPLPASSKQSDCAAACAAATLDLVCCCRAYLAAARRQLPGSIPLAWVLVSDVFVPLVVINKDTLHEVHMAVSGYMVALWMQVSTNMLRKYSLCFDAPLSVWELWSRQCQAMYVCSSPLLGSMALAGHASQWVWYV